MIFFLQSKEKKMMEIVLSSEVFQKRSFICSSKQNYSIKKASQNNLLVKDSLKSLTSISKKIRAL